jgi:peptide/nickel transport system permease protein
MSATRMALAGERVRAAARDRRMLARRLWIGGTIALLLVLVAAPGLLARGDPYELHVGDRLEAPSLPHPFGTDEAGRDILDRVVYGARVSLGTAALIVGLAAAFGTAYGALSGWVGGRLDRLLMRVVDLFLAFPYLVLAMAVAASLGRGTASAVVALALVWWPSYARMVRGQVLSLKNDLHVRVARTLGASGGQTLRWHVVPHTFDQLNVRFTLDLGYAVIALTGLSFLGLGAQNPSPEWGLMIANAKSYVFTAWWYAVFPGLSILAVVLNFVAIGDELARQRR